MIVHGVKCLMCGYEIYSRARHDFHYCKCGNVYIDGGQDGYMRYGAIFFDKAQSVDKELQISKHDLFQDWNKEEDKFTLYKDDTYNDEKISIARAKVLLRGG